MKLRIVSLFVCCFLLTGCQHVMAEEAVPEPTEGSHSHGAEASHGHMEVHPRFARFFDGVFTVQDQVGRKEESDHFDVGDVIAITSVDGLAALVVYPSSTNSVLSEYSGVTIPLTLAAEHDHATGGGDSGESGSSESSAAGAEETTGTPPVPCPIGIKPICDRVEKNTPAKTPDPHRIILCGGDFQFEGDSARYNLVVQLRRANRHISVGFADNSTHACVPSVLPHNHGVAHAWP